MPNKCTGEWEPYAPTPEEQAAHLVNVSNIEAETMRDCPYDLSTYRWGQYPMKEILIGVLSYRDDEWALIGAATVYNHEHGRDDRGRPCWVRRTPDKYTYSAGANTGYHMPFTRDEAEKVRQAYVTRYPTQKWLLNGDPLEAMHAKPIDNEHYTIVEFGMTKYGGGITHHEPDLLKRGRKSDFKWTPLPLKELRAIGKFQGVLKEYGQLAPDEKEQLDTIMRVFHREKQFEPADLLGINGRTA
jgi:hypothetical protein